MVQPTDYTVKTIDPTEAFTKTLGMYQGIEQNQQAIDANKLALESARQKIEADRAAQQRLSDLSAKVELASRPDATREEMLSILPLTTTPQQYDAFQARIASMDTREKRAKFVPAAQVVYALHSGNYAQAEKQLNAQADAQENSGDTVTAAQTRALAATIKEDQGKTVLATFQPILASDSDIGMPLLTAMPAALKLPAEIAMGKTEAARSGSLATTAAAEAAVAPQVAQLDLQERRARIGQSKAATNEAQVRTQAFQDELKRVAENPEVKLTAGSQLTLNKMVDEATTGMTDAERFKGLADKLATSKLPGGIFGSASKFIADATGQTDLLRSDITRYTNTSVMKQLPPGSASDSDVAVTRGGFPKPNASMKTWASYYRGASVVAGVDAQQKANRAEWLALNGDMGPAKRPMVVDGRQVKPGETLLKYQTRSIRPVLDSVNARLGITGPEPKTKNQPATAGSKPGWGKASIVPGA